MRRIYNPCERVRARSVGPNPTGAALLCYHLFLMKVEKQKFDDVLAKLLKAKPEPRKKIKTTGRRGSKAPILSKP
jgi:hypothetical protein